MLNQVNQYSLELKDVSCAFATHGIEDSYIAVKDISLQIKEGEFVSIVGPTGCGKSTLLNVAAGLLEPSKGQILSFDKPLKGINSRAGYMFQSDALMPWCNARDNVAMGLKFRKFSAKELNEMTEEWLRRVGMNGFGDRYPHQLSGGMRKRIALAQTLALDPDIILMDEPFSALDIQTRQLMENEVLALCSGNATKPGKSILFITHDLDEAIAMSDRVLILSAGPGSKIIGEFNIDLPKPRDVAEIRNQPRFYELYQAIWTLLRNEVLKSYELQKQANKYNGPDV